ncbi:MAG: nuclear transport factor 2 family protein [Alphaproteobacteria bacterium]|nr:nuclear transport factor 2 family protein [Alphaproteobacteria bacterium]
MHRLNRQELIDLVETQYFARMDEKRLDEMLAAVAEDCVFTIYPAGDVAAGRDSGIRDLFQTAFETYPEMWHGNFEWVVDEAGQRLAASFDVRLVDRAGKETVMRNGKFFSVSDGKLAALNLYLSTSDAIIEVDA